jgi:hypothetical protein
MRPSPGVQARCMLRLAYEMTRKLLIAGNLNWPTLRGGNPAAFERLLTQQQRTEFVAGLHTTVLYKGRGREEHPRVGCLVRSWQHPVRHHPGQGARYAERRHRVRNRYRYQGAADQRRLRLRLRDRAARQACRVDADHPAALRVGGFRAVGRPRRSARTLVRHGRRAAGGLCGKRDGYIHPDFPQGPPPSVTPSGAPQDPYSLATPSTFGCHRTTRT